MKDQQLCEHCGYNQFIVTEKPKRELSVVICIICARCRETYQSEDLISPKFTQNQKKGYECRICKNWVPKLGIFRGCTCGGIYTKCSQESEEMTEKKLECGECLAKENEYHKIWCPNKPNVKIGSNLEEECKDAFSEDMNKANDGDAIPIPPEMSDESIRTFTSGATRHVDDEKHDYEGFLSPWTIRRYGEYMQANRVQADGSIRDSDNWQKGIPRSQYMKSLMRHSIDAWSIFRGLFTFDKKDDSEVGIEDALCGVIFNASGLLHEVLRKRNYK